MNQLTRRYGWLAFVLFFGSVAHAETQDQLSGLASTHGVGTKFGADQCEQFKKLYSNSKLAENKKVQWVLMDLDADQRGVIVDQSSNIDQRIFGASTSKIFVAAALLDRRGGQLTDRNITLMKSMIIQSSNAAWSELQTVLGDGSWQLGQRRNLIFTQKIGLHSTRGFSGTIAASALGDELKTLKGNEQTAAGGIHGNELTARETTELVYDIVRGKFAGAEILRKIMSAYRTGSAKGNKYVPSDIAVGGKTGTYGGESIELGKAVNVNVRNTALFFKGRNGKRFGITVLANTGADETSALIVGGLIRKYGGVTEGACN